MDVQATLLYRTLRPVDFGALVACVNDWMGIEDMALAHSPAAGDTHILLTNPNYHAIISVVGAKVDAGVLNAALSAPILAAKSFDYSDALSAHKMHVSVTVGDGPMHVTPEIRAWMSRMGKHQESPSYPLDRKLAALNAIVQTLVAHDVPELVHWGQSDMIFTPDEVLEASDMLFPLPLVVRPEPIFANAANGLEQTGVRLEHSELFVGRTLVMEPSALPFPEAMGIAMWLMSQKVDGRLMLEHGAAMETPGFPTLYLRHEMPDAQDAQGRIVITQSQPHRYAVAPQYMAAPMAQPAPQMTAQPAAAPQPIAATDPAQGQQYYAPHHMQQPMVQQPYAQPQQPMFMHQPMVAQPQPMPQNVVPMQQPAPVAEAAPEQAAPAAEPTEAAEAPAPAPAQEAPAAGWRNAAKAPQGATLGAALKSATPAARGAAPTAASLKPSLQANVLSHHTVDVAAGLVQKAQAEEAQPKSSLLRGMHLRAVSGIVAVFLVVAAGVTMAPKFIGEGVELASTSASKPSSLSVNAGPKLPGQN
ncbi:hypothetical protein VK792_02105 [Mesobacterium sp. TK19101]|uniref:Uncharacterized protein n=1 Tax=Mesobacterium hydrothermale TaxID=3111907 RepID=A0ABU6HD65_9RHOB|nr:hypothetical protein [Mesobacterium sp. TK19101]MEC3860067.1 hypothetical protein [Mesobacterium sp. TK19101]